MPRDDLTIDFVPGVTGAMPPDSNLDPALILDEWANRVVNLPEEIKFVQDEIADKDRQVADCLKKIEDHDSRIQKWIRVNGSHAPNPQEDAHRAQVRLNFARAEQLANEKIALTHRLQNIIDKHLRHLDAQIKVLFDRGEPGFVDPDELPSLLRPSAANVSAPSAATASPSATSVAASLAPLANPAVALGPKGTSTQLRHIQTAAPPPPPAAAAAASFSAPVSPAASLLLKRGARETSAGPGGGAPARPRLNTAFLGALPGASSGLARHSSLGPGTPRGLTAAGHVRAGSAGPRAGVKGAAALPLRKGTPSGGRSASSKKAGGGGGRGSAGGADHSGLQRVRKTASKNSPSSTVDSELSDADSAASSNDSDAPVSQRSGGRGTPARSCSNSNNNHNNSSSSTSGPSASAASNQHQHHYAAQSNPPSRPNNTNNNNNRPSGAPRTKRDDHHHQQNPNDQAYVDEDENRKYCVCQKVSFGDMVACDNEDCPYEWFHWSCVGLKSAPTEGGLWYCPVCAKEREES